MDAWLQNQMVETERPVYYRNMLPESGRLYMIVVKEIEKGRPQGIIHNLFFPEVQSFDGWDSAIFIMDDMMDLLSTPLAATELREFIFSRQKARVTQKEKYEQWLRGDKDKIPITQYWESDSMEYDDPCLEIFYIRVLYRQYSSWQGEVVWKGHEKIRFRSVLELLHLLKAAFSRYEKNIPLSSEDKWE